MRSALKTLLQQLAERQLLVVTGKGGVGKSTLSATLGSTLAGMGKRVLVLEVDPRDSLHRLLNLPPSGGEIVRAAPGFFVQNLRPRAMLDRMVRERLRIDLLADRVLASPVYRHFAEGAPGLKEMAVIEHAFRLVRGKLGGKSSFDTVVLDAPATGHGLALLTAPLTVSEVIHDGPVGHLGRKLAGFVSDSSRCGIILVTAAEEMPVQEAIELIAALDERLSREPELVMVNCLMPAAPDRADSLPALLGERRRVNERQLRRLRESWKGAHVELPMLPLDGGPALMTALEERLQRALAEAT